MLQRLQAQQRQASAAVFDGPIHLTHTLCLSVQHVLGSVHGQAASV